MIKNTNNTESSKYDQRKMKGSLTNTLASPRLNENHAQKPIVYTTKSYAAPQQQRKGILTSSNTTNPHMIKLINDNKSSANPPKGISLNSKHN